MYWKVVTSWTEDVVIEAGHCDVEKDGSLVLYNMNSICRYPKTMVAAFSAGNWKTVRQIEVKSC